jgi:hypothetical protein
VRKTCEKSMKKAAMPFVGRIIPIVAMRRRTMHNLSTKRRLVKWNVKQAKFRTRDLEIT